MAQQPTNNIKPDKRDRQPTVQPFQIHDTNPAISINMLRNINESVINRKADLGFITGRIGVKGFKNTNSFFRKSRIIDSKIRIFGSQ